MDNLFKDLPREQEPVECLGITFENDVARRTYLLDKLRQKLQDPEFRKIEGFPIGEDEDILALSDPPYYTTCPNPFLEDFIRHYGQAYDPNADAYHREPFAVDVSEGKTDPIYSAHAYHTKVPYRAIMRAILYYTNPNDLVLDGFAGSGMTGVAVQMCGQPPLDFKQQIELEWQAAKRSPPQWGARRVVLNELSPAATFIAANYNLPFDLGAFDRAAGRILTEVKKELGWMYETGHTDGKTKGQINYTVWSEVFSCPECGGEIVFYQEAFDQKTKRVKDTFFCPHCGTELTKLRLERLYETYSDPQINILTKRLKRLPVLINYSIGKHRFEKKPNKDDLAILQKAEQLSLSPTVPTNEIPYMHMTHQRAKMEIFGITHLHHFYLPRIAYTLGKIYERIGSETEVRLRNALFFLFDSQLVNLSVQNRYRPEVSFPYNPLSGVYYVSSLVSEANPFIAFENKVTRLVRVFSGYEPKLNNSIISTGDCGRLEFIPDKSIDYVFTDPPFGENIYYADLNFLVGAYAFTSTKNCR